MTEGSEPSGRRRGLLVDYGGVLTGSLGSVFRRAEQQAGVPQGALVRLLLDAYDEPSGHGWVHRFERGEIDAATFEQAMRDALEASGHAVAEGPLLTHVFAGLGPDLDNSMWSFVAGARRRGIATCLVSNSWGTDGYPMAQLNEAFDDLVISGEVGLRKPDPAIYLLAAERVGVEVHDCAFVDDFPGNVDAADALGMFAVLHTGDAAATIDALEGFLGPRGR